MKRYYVLFIEQDVEPEMHGPYETERERDGQALRLRMQDPEDLPSGIFPLQVETAGAVSVDTYSGGFFEDQSLYEEAILLGLDVDHHETDLYLKDCDEARALLERHDARGKMVRKVDGWNVSRFISEVDGEAWLDVPFAYDPNWRAKA